MAPDRDQIVPLALAAPPADGDGDAVPDAADVCPSVADPAQEDGDADGDGDACVCRANLIANGGFEAGTTGWTAPNGNLAWAEGGRVSAHAARICKADAGGPSLNVLSDDPDTVDAPAVGARFHLEAWARAEQPEPSQNVRPRLRERDAGGGEITIHQNGGITLTAEWQEITLDAVIAGPDPASLEVYFSSVDAADGTCFLMDDICLAPLD